MTEETKAPQTKISFITVLWNDEGLEEFDDVAQAAFIDRGNSSFLQILDAKGNLTEINTEYVYKIKFYNEVVH